jgi:hypothetical protein
LGGSDADDGSGYGGSDNLDNRVGGGVKKLFILFFFIFFFWQSTSKNEFVGLGERSFRRWNTNRHHSIAGRRYQTKVGFSIFKYRPRR